MHGKFIQVATDRYIYAFDPQTGEQLWQSEVAGGSYWGYQQCIGDGKYYAHNYDGRVYAFDPETGELVWKSISTREYNEELGIPLNCSRFLLRS